MILLLEGLRDMQFLSGRNLFPAGIILSSKGFSVEREKVALVKK